MKNSKRCPECGYEIDVEEEPIDEGNIQENTRGW